MGTKKAKKEFLLFLSLFALFTSTLSFTIKRSTL
jgi:hypothetical protein